VVEFDASSATSLQTVQWAWVGDIQAARMAGIKPGKGAMSKAAGSR